MSKKTLISICIETLPNGYAMTIDGKEYMYLNVEDLIAGFFTHVAVGKTDFIDSDMADGILLAAAQWKTVGEALEANAAQIASVRKAQWSEVAAIRSQAAANERAEKAENERKRLYRENLELRAEIMALENKIKRIGETMVNRHKSKVVIEDPEKTSRGRQRLITGKKRYARKD